MGGKKKKKKRAVVDQIGGETVADQAPCDQVVSAAMPVKEAKKKKKKNRSAVAMTSASLLSMKNLFDDILRRDTERKEKAKIKAAEKKAGKLAAAPNGTLGSSPAPSIAWAIARCSFMPKQG